MPDDYLNGPGPQVHAYLHSYAKHNLHRLFQLNTNVTLMDRRADGKPGWTLTLEAGSHTWTDDFDFVAIGTGQFSDKNIITHPGQDGFEAAGGQVMHSSEYTDPQIVKGKSVVVLGGSKSATDIAVNAVNNGAALVHWVCLEPVWRVPYFVGGINFKHLLYMRAQEEQFNSWGKNRLQRVIAAIFKPLVWMNFRGLETAQNPVGLEKVWVGTQDANRKRSPALSRS